MYEARLVKKWKVIEVQLNQAAQFLNQPEICSLSDQEFADYRFDLREEELTEAMGKLEEIARVHGAKSGFWKRIKKVAESIGNQEKVSEYEEQFHAALAKNA